MASTAADISQAIRSRLKVVDPDISAEPLTIERKLIDTFAEALAETNIDQYVLSYQYDIDTKVGSDLDKFVALFGFARQSGKTSSGSVAFQRNTVATDDIPIVAGTQVIKPATSVSPAVIFQTTANVTLYAGTLSVTAPIQCTIAGEVGNVPAGTIAAFGNAGASNISSVTNTVATTGGVSAETDAELRVRFKNTIFRNISGTQDQYLAIAIASRFANKANVIGPISRFIEYLQIDALGNATSQIPYSKYTYGFDYYLTDGALISEHFYSPRGADYTFTAGVPPTIAVNNATNLPTGAIVLLEHSYCSLNSRNDPANNIGNFVDVYVSGQDVTSVTESAVFPGSGNNFNGTPSSPFYTSSFRRVQDNSNPLAGNRFQELMWQPVFDLPGSITIGSRTYYQNSDYWLVNDVTSYRGSRRARNGIEWSATAIATITASAPFVFVYDFDRLPLTLNEVMEAHKQVTSDVLVHSANERYFNTNFVVMYTPGYSRNSVDQAISTALTNFLEKMSFGAVIQVSDIIDIVHQVPGVDNVRLTTPADGTAYGIQEVASNGVTPIGSPYTIDFALQDSDLPVLNKVVTTQRSQNTWS